MQAVPDGAPHGTETGLASYNGPMFQGWHVRHGSKRAAWVNEDAREACPAGQAPGRPEAPPPAVGREPRAATSSSSGAAGREQGALEFAVMHSAPLARRGGGCPAVEPVLSFVMPQASIIVPGSSGAAFHTGGAEDRPMGHGALGVDAPWPWAPDGAPGDGPDSPPATAVGSPAVADGMACVGPAPCRVISSRRVLSPPSPAAVARPAGGEYLLNGTAELSSGATQLWEPHDGDDLELPEPEPKHKPRPPTPPRSRRTRAGTHGKAPDQQPQQPQQEQQQSESGQVQAGAESEADSSRVGAGRDAGPKQNGDNTVLHGARHRTLLLSALEGKGYRPSASDPGIRPLAVQPHQNDQQGPNQRSGLSGVLAMSGGSGSGPGYGRLPAGVRRAGTTALSSAGGHQQGPAAPHPRVHAGGRYVRARTGRDVATTRLADIMWGMYPRNER